MGRRGESWEGGRESWEGGRERKAEETWQIKRRKENGKDERPNTHKRAWVK